MAEKKGLNAQEVLENINKCIAEIRNGIEFYWRYPRYARTRSGNVGFKIREVCEELSIFDWWNEELSMSQLKQMRAFVKTAIKLGFTGYVCFKVGATGCSHGMWAAKDESLDGYSPKCDTLFHSFRCDENNWSICLNDKWGAYNMTLAEIKDAIARKEV